MGSLCAAAWVHASETASFCLWVLHGSVTFHARLARNPSKHLCREEIITWTALHLSTDSVMPMASISNFLVSNYTDTVTTPTVLKDHQTRQHEPRPNFLQSGNAAILARSHTCTAGMALKIHDVERAFPVQHLVRTYSRRQASIFPTRLRFIEGSLARQNSNGVSTAGTRARSNSDGRWFKLGICWATSTAVTSESPLNSVMYSKVCTAVRVRGLRNLGKLLYYQHSCPNTS